MSKDPGTPDIDPELLALSIDELLPLDDPEDHQLALSEAADEIDKFIVLVEPDLDPAIIERVRQYSACLKGVSTIALDAFNPAKRAMLNEAMQASMREATEIRESLNHAEVERIARESERRTQHNLRLSAELRALSHHPSPMAEIRRQRNVKCAERRHLIQQRAMKRGRP